MTPRHPMRAVHVRRRVVAMLILLAIMLALGAVLRLMLSDAPPEHFLSRHHQIPAASFVVSPTFGDAEATAVEATRKRTPIVAVAGRRKRQVALTFDDGPGPYTMQVVRALARAQAPATFFQVGQTAKVFTAEEHHLVHSSRFVLAAHTEQHRDLTHLPRAAQISEIDDGASVLTTAGAPSPQLFRPPYGAFDRTTLDLLERRHMLMVLWTVDSRDYERPGVNAIVKRVVDGVRPGAIVLMHDGGGNRSQTAASIPKVVQRLRAKHYTLVTVPRLLLDNPPPLKQPSLETGVG